VSHEHVLLLGGTGFIGSALTTRLRRDLRVVHVVGRKEVHKLKQLLSNCSTVIHLASATTPSASSEQPALEQANMDLTGYLVQCLKGHPDTHLIYFSSGGTVYGNPLQLPVCEDSAITPISPYGMAKVAQENICRGLRAQGNAVTILRPSNVYGPGQTAKPGFGLVRTLLEHARLGTTLDIWGDGTNVRDFIYIDDIIEATLSLISRPQRSETYNVGGGLGYSVNQVKNLVEQATGLQINTVYRAARGIDVHAVVLDSTRLYAQMGWKPEVSLAQGIGRILELSQPIHPKPTGL
jgi:UDP-glucose 4-epimerase